MAGIVSRMAQWYPLSDGAENKLRPLSRIELIELANLFPSGVDFSNLEWDQLPTDVLRVILTTGIVDWKFTDAEGAPVPCTDEDKPHVDPDTFTFALSKIMELSGRSSGEVEGSETNS